MKEKKNIPVKEQQVLEVTIQATGSRGDGIAKINGYALIIPHAVEGTTVEVKVTKVYPKYAFAQLL